MSDFNISARDISNPKRIFEEMFKDSPNGLVSSRSRRNVPVMNLNMYTFSEMLMRTPAITDPAEIMQFQESIVSGALGSVWDEEKVTESGLINLIPEDLRDMLFALSEDPQESSDGGGDSGGDANFSVNIPNREDITPSTRPLGVDSRTQPVARFGAQVAREVLGFDGIIGGWDGNRAPSSDHYSGHALDLMVSKIGHVAQGDEKRMGNLIAQFFLANKDALKVSYIIWFRREIGHYTGWNWRTYQRGENKGVTWRHQDHPHISFKKEPAPNNPRLVWPDGVYVGNENNNSSGGASTSGHAEFG